MTNTADKKDEKEKKPSLPFFGIPQILPYLKPFRKYLFLMIGTGLIGSLGDIILPLFQKYAINHFIGEQTLNGIWIFVILYLLVLSIQVVSNFFSTYSASRVELYTNRDLRQAAFNHLQTLSFSYFNQNSVGYIHARIMSDTSRIGETISWSLMDGVWNITYLIGAVVVMLMHRWKLALLVMAVIPFTAVLVSIFEKKLLVINRKIREKNSVITGNFNEGIVGAKSIKTMAIEEKVCHDLRRDSEEMKKISVHATQLRTLFWTTVSFGSSIALALVLWQGGKLTLDRMMELGTLSIFMTYALGIMEPVLWVVDSISSMITVQVNIERFTNLMKTKSDVIDTPEVIEKYGDTFHPKKENWEPLHGDIEFRDVSFHYPDGEEMVLEHFSLKVPAGTNVAIVGETGAGKSTLVNLVCRFYEPTEGSVLIDGKDARTRSQLWLHSYLGYVLQTPHLFSGTVRENLLYGNPDATDEEIEAALARVSANEVVSRMEKGLESDVGEGGNLLSTGEKQLISFARAILADPRILVLDEATSSIDTVTEQKIQNAIEEVIRGRTSFVIAHRLSTIRNADVILAVRGGRIVERGTHDELMAQKGYYHMLYTRQFEEDLINQML